MSLTPVTNTFTTYALTDEEIDAGSVLSELQMALLQNDLAEAAQQKMQLKVDNTNVTVFIQREAELQGRILILTAILDRSKAVIQSRLDAQSNFTPT